VLVVAQQTDLLPHFVSDLSGATAAARKVAAPEVCLRWGSVRGFCETVGSPTSHQYREAELAAEQGKQSLDMLGQTGA